MVCEYIVNQPCAIIFTSVPHVKHQNVLKGQIIYLNYYSIIYFLYKESNYCSLKSELAQHSTLQLYSYWGNTINAKLKLSIKAKKVKPFNHFLSLNNVIFIAVNLLQLC